MMGGTAVLCSVHRQQLQLPHSQAEHEVGPGHFSILYVIYGLNVSLLFSHTTIQKAGKLANKNNNNKYIVRPKYV
jgi:hypothetical protein